MGHIATECDFDPSVITEWDLSSCLAPAVLYRVECTAARPGFCYRMPWLPGAKDFLKALQTLDEVVAVTAPWHSDTWESERRAALSPYLGRVISCHGTDKALIRGDILIEDNPSYARKWLEHNPDGFAILMDAPWNGEESTTFEGQDHPRMQRAYGYTDALEIIEGIKEVFK